jgi:hypothetical protein
LRFNFPTRHRPFVGSGNNLYWLLRQLPGARAVAFENDPQVYQLS